MEVDWNDGLSETEVRVLSKLGWSETRLATLSDLSLLQCIELVEELRKINGLGGLDPAAFQQHVKDMATKHAEAWRIEARQPEADLLVASRCALEDRRRCDLERMQHMEVNLVVARVGKAKRVRMPSRLARKQVLAGDDMQLREKAEKLERMRWIRGVKDIIQDAQMPAANSQRVGELADVRFAKGRRASTLRKHVKTWLVAAHWFKCTYDVDWPREANQVIHYLETRLAEPCAKTFPDSFFRTLMYLEHAGEVAEGFKLTDHPGLRNMLEECRVRLESKNLVMKRQAKLLPVNMVIAWERMVVNEEVGRYSRVHCWFRLLKLWGGLRFSDTQGVVAKTMKVNEDGLEAEIHRSKTSGAGKKLGVLKFFVSKHAWIDERHWLMIGWQLMKQMEHDAGVEERDFLLPAPKPSGDGFVRKMVSYALASAMSQAIFNMLWAEVRGVRKAMVEEEVGLTWTERSERATLRTWSQGAQVPEDVRKQMGRWRPSTDEGYQRNARANILRSHRRIAEYIKTNKGREDVFDEEEVLRDIGRRMAQYGADNETIDEQKEKLRYFAEPGEWHDAQFNVEWTSEGPIHLNLRGQDRKSREDTEDEKMDDGWDEEDDDDDEADDEKNDTAKLRGQFVCSIVGRSKTRTLHKVGECHRLPSVHYHEYEVLGFEVPKPEKYHKACSICFPDKERLISLEEQESSSEDVSSSDTTESGEEEDGEK